MYITQSKSYGAFLHVPEVANFLMSRAMICCTLLWGGVIRHEMLGNKWVCNSVNSSLDQTRTKVKLPHYVKNFCAVCSISSSGKANVTKLSCEQGNEPSGSIKGGEFLA
jgi:hypothetical protein